MTAPEVSVIIAAWRAEATLERAVRSALAQEGVTVEVVVVDDASPDGTEALARRLAAADRRVRAIGLGRNRGPAPARNRAIAEARGTWIAVLDADDAMQPDRLARMCGLAREWDADMVLGNLALGDGRPFVPLPPEPAPIDLAGWVAGNLAAANRATLGYLKPLVARGFLAAHGLAYDESLRNGEDFHLVLAVLAAGGRVWLSPRPDYLYSRRAGSVSHRADPADLRALAAADRRFAAQHDDPAIARMLRRKARATLRLASAETALAALRTGRPGQAAGVMLRHPAALPRTLRQIAQALRHRLHP